MLRALVAILLVLWLLGFTLHIAGSLIHLLVVVAVLVLLVDLLRPAGGLTTIHRLRLAFGWRSASALRSPALIRSSLSRCGSGG